MQAWAPPGQYTPAAGWYPDPAGSGVLLWWDGRGWTAPIPWPPPEVPAPPPGRIAVWLASPASSPLLVAVAVGSAAGWLGAAAVVVSAAAIGHPLEPAASALNFAAFVLPVLDVVTGMCSRACRARRTSAPARAARAVRKAARRAPDGTRRWPAAIQGVCRALRRSRGSAPFGLLPRAVGWVFAATAWSTVLLLVGLTVWVLPGGGITLGDAGATAGSQQLAAAVWMMHLIVWCGAACKRLNRNHASQLRSAYSIESNGQSRSSQARTVR